MVVYPKSPTASDKEDNCIKEHYYNAMTIIIKLLLLLNYYY